MDRNMKRVIKILFRAWLMITLIAHGISFLLVGGIVYMQFTNLPTAARETAVLESGRIALLAVLIAGFVIVALSLRTKQAGGTKAHLGLLIYCALVMLAWGLRMIWPGFAPWLDFSDVAWFVVGGVLVFLQRHGGSAVPALVERQEV